MKRSTSVIVSNLLRDNILFSTLHTGLFLLLGKNWGGAQAPLAPPLATALLIAGCTVVETPGTTISENALRDDFAVLMKPFKTYIALSHCHSTNFIVRWSPGHVAVAVQVELDGSGSPDSLGNCFIFLT